MMNRMAEQLARMELNEKFKETKEEVEVEEDPEVADW